VKSVRECKLRGDLLGIPLCRVPFLAGQVCELSDLNPTANLAGLQRGTF
jgi:hypothetical protein